MSERYRFFFSEKCQLHNNIIFEQEIIFPQEKFAEKVGYVRFVEALRALGQPYQELVRTLVDMVS